MSNITIKSGWNTIDDAAEGLQVTDEKQAAVPVKKPTQAAEHSSTQPHRIGMHLSAFTGIAIVVVAVTMYMGVDSLRGSLTGTSSTGTTTITMTADNHFSPSTVSVTAGTTLVLENKNQNPQVLKAKAAPELFPTQVLFEKPVRFVIPAGTQGTFTYISETMPKEELLTITVTPAIETAAVSQANLPPLPFGGPLSEIVSSQASSVSHSDSVITVVPTSDQSSDQDAVTVISVGGTVQASSAQTENKNTSDIPENPYTVAHGKKNGSVGAQIAKNEKTLHSGAPLLDYPEYRPQRNTETGQVAWVVILSAISGLMALYRMKILT